MMRSAFLLMILSCFYWASAQAQSCNALWSSNSSGTIVSFQNQSSSVNPVTNYLWDFGDGSFSAMENPLHAYAAQGSYGVTLTISNANGCSSQFYDTLMVMGSCSTSCQASFSYLENGSVVHFTDSSFASGNVTSWYWDFGDGSFSYSQNPNHAFAVAGHYNVCLTITTDDSCSSTFCDSVATQCASICGPAAFTYSISGDTVSFVNTSGGTYASSGWVFGGGVPNSSQTNPTVIYPGPGSYNVCLCIYDANGNLCDIVCETIVIPANSSCQANFISYDSLGYTHFDDISTASSPILGWFWDLGDGNFSYQQYPSHIYASSGTYPVCLTIYTADSCSSTFCDTVNVVVGCTANAQFSYTINGNSVSFTNNSNIPAGGSYIWRFSDGGFSLQLNPTYQFSGPGVYYACLTVSDSLGYLCSDTLCETIVIPAISNCQANFISYDSLGYTHFDDVSTASSPILGWFWDLGDGNFSYQQYPSHIYASSGTYPVCLTIYTADSCSSTFCDTVNVVVGCTANAQFSYTINGNSVSFTNNSNIPAGGSYIWRFSDGGFSLQLNPTYQFSGPGVYYACLTVSDSLGFLCSDTLCETIVIPAISNCQANFISYDSLGYTHFDDISTASSPILGWFWDLGDGNFSYQQYPSHIYASSGTYPVCLTIYTADSCSSTFCDTVNVVVGCTANAQFSYTINGNSVSFTNNSIVPVGGSYYWHFSDGGFSSQFNPTYQFSGPGHYTACLTVRDSLGMMCSDTLCESFTISQSSWGQVFANDLRDILFRSAPNPTEGNTEIQFELPESSSLRISVFDLTGKEVKVITEGERNTGIHQIEWQASDLPAGLYFYHIQLGEQVLTEKLVIL